MVEVRFVTRSTISKSLFVFVHITEKNPFTILFRIRFLIYYGLCMDINFQTSTIFYLITLGSTHTWFYSFGSITSVSKGGIFSFLSYSSLGSTFGTLLSSKSTSSVCRTSRMSTSLESNKPLSVSLILRHSIFDSSPPIPLYWGNNSIRTHEHHGRFILHGWVNDKLLTESVQRVFL